jgi:hypothetical protein
MTGNEAQGRKISGQFGLYLFETIEADVAAMQISGDCVSGFDDEDIPPSETV